LQERRRDTYIYAGGGKLRKEDEFADPRLSKKHSFQAARMKETRESDWLCPVGAPLTRQASDCHFGEPYRTWWY